MVRRPGAPHRPGWRPSFPAGPLLQRRGSGDGDPTTCRTSDRPGWKVSALAVRMKILTSSSSHDFLCFLRQQIVGARSALSEEDAAMNGAVDIEALLPAALGRIM